MADNERAPVRPLTRPAGELIRVLRAILAELGGISQSLRVIGERETGGRNDT
jgi:hypothetical protein